MSKGDRDLTADERKLWRLATSAVKTHRALPLEVDPAEPLPPPSREGTRAARAPGKPAPAERNVTSLPQNRSAEKHVRRGDVEIDATLDLHGHKQDTALAALTRFLRLAQKRGHRVVVVITGVGRGGDGVLRRMLPIWLAGKEVRALVAGYAQSHRSHGGAGAFYVFVKRFRDERV